jgi:hypothetical protein
MWKLINKEDNAAAELRSEKISAQTVVRSSDGIYMFILWDKEL